MSKPLKVETLDSSSGVLFPYYDYDTRVVYLSGKVCIKHLGYSHMSYFHK